jgi:hypothetical protein
MELNILVLRSFLFQFVFFKLMPDFPGIQRINLPLPATASSPPANMDM